MSDWHFEGNLRIASRLTLSNRPARLQRSDPLVGESSTLPDRGWQQMNGSRLPKRCGTCFARCLMTSVVRAKTRSRLVAHVSLWTFFLCTYKAYRFGFPVTLHNPSLVQSSVEFPPIAGPSIFVAWFTDRASAIAFELPFPTCVAGQMP